MVNGRFKHQNYVPMGVVGISLIFSEIMTWRFEGFDRCIINECEEETYMFTAKKWRGFLVNSERDAGDSASLTHY